MVSKKLLFDDLDMHVMMIDKDVKVGGTTFTGDIQLYITLSTMN